VTETGSVRVAVDAMGGDGGLGTTIAGVELALQADTSLEVQLVGPESAAEALNSAPAAIRRRIELTVANSVLPADASPAHALRHGRGSSLYTALELIQKNQADAVVSAGSTAALMVLSRQLLGMLSGVERPALMAAIPTLSRPVWMLDLGANVNVDARRLLEFAQMGDGAFRVLEKRAPRIGLLNIGSEPGKGPDMIREAARLIDAEQNLAYAGFVEADQVFAARVDLVVCDGFAGNVLLKSAEGAIRLMFSAMTSRFEGSLSGWMARPRLRSLHDMLEPARHNGAPMLGVRGTVIKSHGSACPRGFAHAIALAAAQARGGLIEQLESQLWASY
jgi:phosphate acyltransferase